MTNPYHSQPPTSFWSTSVAKPHFLDISDLWRPKWSITSNDKVVTFGSCFAQHFGRALKDRGYAWTNYEVGPITVGPNLLKQFNYGIFSARTGNIYTTSLLRQWISWAIEKETPPSEVWRSNGRVYDPFRPRIEPDGFRDEEELVRSRACTLAALKHGLLDADVFVFTLGLTESWTNSRGRYEYPMCPGTTAGEFDPQFHNFMNMTYPDVKENLVSAISEIRSINPSMRFLLTVSPVPLVATATQKHVLLATTYSKSVLRAVAGDVADAMDEVDYFPSYEIISSPVFRGTFFDPNLRTVNPKGVAHVMSQFFSMQGISDVNIGLNNATKTSGGDLVCEEQLLDAFGGRD